MDLLDVTNFALDRILNVSSNGRQQPMPGNPALVERPSPCADTGTAGVSDSLESRERAELIDLRRQRRAHELLIADLVELLPGNPDGAFDRVIEAHSK